MTRQQRTEIQLQLNEVVKQKQEAIAADDFDRSIELMAEQTRLWESLHRLPNWQRVDWVVISNDDAD